MSVWAFAAGFAAGVGSAWAFHRFMGGDGQIDLPDKSQSTLRGKIVPVPTSGSTAGAGLVPMAGVRSREGYEWGYIAGDGDTAGDIARAITGDDGRYQDLIAANPQLKRVGEIGIFLTNKSWEFAPGELHQDVALLLPPPWSRYIDQLGNARGSTTPFPQDTRTPSLTGVSGRAASSPKVLAGDGYAPFGKLIELEAAA